MCAFSLFLSIFRPYGIFAQAGTTFNLNMEEKWVRKEVADRRRREGLSITTMMPDTGGCSVYFMSRAQFNHLKAGTGAL